MLKLELGNNFSDLLDEAEQDADPAALCYIEAPENIGSYLSNQTNFFVSKIFRGIIGTVDVVRDGEGFKSLETDFEKVREKLDFESILAEITFYISVTVDSDHAFHAPLEYFKNATEDMWHNLCLGPNRDKYSIFDLCDGFALFTSEESELTENKAIAFLDGLIESNPALIGLQYNEKISFWEVIREKSKMLQERLSDESFCKAVKGLLMPENKNQRIFYEKKIRSFRKRAGNLVDISNTAIENYSS